MYNKCKRILIFVCLLFLITTIQALAQSFAVSGIVTENGEPLPGVTVMVRGSATGTATDANGRYQLTVPGPDAVLQFTYVGFVTIEEIVGDRREVNVEMSEEASHIDELVVVGYGTQRRANLTGAVDQVTAKTLENRPVTNVSQSLVGAVPNLNIRFFDGKPTQSPSYNIRGTTSIGQGGSALVLIDGVEGDPGMLNPNDIESISVLKDASSASIYGARATFGVILITTKSPVKGRTTVTYSTNLSSKKPTAVPDLITDSYPWAKNFSDALSRWNDDGRVPTNVNKTLRFSQAYLDEIERRWQNPSLPRYEVQPDGYYWYFYNTEWFKELYKESFFAQDHNLSLSGGSDIASFYVTGRYNGHDGLYRYNTDLYSMYNLRAKGIVQLTDWLQVENNMEFSNMNYRQPYNVGEGSNIWRNIADEAHPLAPLTNPDGTLSMSSAYTVGDMFLGKSFGLFQQRVIKNQVSAKAEFFEKSLTIRSDYTFQNRDYSHEVIRTQVPFSDTQGFIAYIGQNTNDFEERRHATQYQATNIYANYVKSFDFVHNFNFLVGYNYEQSEYKNLLARRNGIVFEEVQDLALAIGENIVTEGGYDRWRIAGGFFRVNYNFRERYLLEFNGRYDGSSKFPEHSQWAFFPSVSVGWRISEESFWNLDQTAISNLKVRASYGSLGNGSIQSYRFSERFSISQLDRIIGSSRPQRTTQPNVIPRSLTWETATIGNIGLDVVALSNRLNFTADVYRRWTTDMYTVGPSLPHIFGTSVPSGNYASLETTGFELSLGWNDRFDVASKPLRYDLRVTLADYKAIITEFYNPEFNLNDYYKGQTYGEIWGYRVEGLFRSEEEIASSPSQRNIQNNSSRTNYVGDLKFKKLEGDDSDEIFRGNNRVGDSGSREIIGNRTPRYSYSFSIGANWNGFFFNSFFQGVMKQHWYPSRESPFWGQYNRAYNGFPRWQENQIFREELGNFDAYLPRLVSNTAREDNRPLGAVNDRYLQNVAYIRLKNLNFGYTIPSNISERIGASDVRVYISGENLWTWSPLYRYTRDIDVVNIYGSGSGRSNFESTRNEGLNLDSGDGDGFNYPTLKTISFGLSITF